LSLLRLVGVTRGQIKRMVHAEQAGLLGVALAIGTAIAAITLSSVVHAVSGVLIPYVPALGAATILGGTVALALVATMLPIGRVLRTPPIEGIGLRE
jgi:putative ABC transport system permease protein